MKCNSCGATLAQDSTTCPKCSSPTPTVTPFMVHNKSQGQSPTEMPNASRSGMSSSTRTIGSVPMLLFIALTCLVILAACGSTQSHPPGAGGTQTQPKLGTIILFSIPTAVSQPWGIVMATNGNLWFTEYYANKIGRITPGGKITEYAIPTADSHPWGLAAGPDGSMWFTELKADHIGRITTGGKITEYNIPNATIEDNVEAITAGPDGNLWFTVGHSSSPFIGRITLAGKVTEFPLPGGTIDNLYGITAGPDGNIWYTRMVENKVGRIAPGGKITEFPIPTANSSPVGITSGPDGNLWFTESDGNKIGMITTK